MSSNNEMHKRARNDYTREIISELLQPDNEYLHRITGEECISTTTKKRRHVPTKHITSTTMESKDICDLPEPKFARRSRSHYNEEANHKDIVLNIDEILDNRDWKYMYTTSFSEYTYRVIELALQFIQIHSVAALMDNGNMNQSTSSRGNSRKRKDFPLTDPFHSIFLQFKNLKNNQLRFRSSSHIVLNPKDKSFTCRVCHLIYPSVQEYKRHFIRSHVNIRCLSDRDITTCQMPMTTIRSRLLRTFFGYERYVKDRNEVREGKLINNKSNSYPSKKQMEKWKFNMVSEEDDKSHNYIDDALYWCKNCNCLFDFREDLSNHVINNDHLTDTINEVITRYQKFTFPTLSETIKKNVDKSICEIRFLVPKRHEMIIPTNIAPHLKYKNNSITTTTTTVETVTKIVPKKIEKIENRRRLTRNRNVEDQTTISNIVRSKLRNRRNLRSKDNKIINKVESSKPSTRSSNKKDVKLIENREKKKKVEEVELIKEKNVSIRKVRKKLIKPEKLLKNILSINSELGNLLCQFQTADIDNMMKIREKIIEEIGRNNQKSSRAKLIAYAKKEEKEEKLKLEKELAEKAATENKKKSSKRERNCRGRATGRNQTEPIEYQFACPNCGSKFRDSRIFHRHEQFCQNVTEIPFRHNPDHPYMTHHRNQYGDRLRNLKNGKTNRRSSLISNYRPINRRQLKSHPRDAFYDVEFINRCNSNNKFELWDKLNKKIRHQFYLHMGIRLNGLSSIHRTERQPFCGGLKDQQILKIDPIYKKLFARLSYHIFHFDDYLHGKRKSSKLLLADVELMNAALMLFHFILKPNRKGKTFKLFEKKLIEMKEKGKEKEKKKNDVKTMTKKKKLDESRININQIISDMRTNDHHYNRIYGKLTSDELEEELNRILTEFQSNFFNMKNFLLIIDAFFEDCFSLDSFPRTMRNRYRLGFPSNNYSPFYSTIQTYETHHVPMLNGPRVHGTQRSLALIATKLNQDISGTSEFLHVSSVDCSFVRHGFLGNKTKKENCLPLMKSKYFIGNQMDIKHQKNLNRFQGEIYSKTFGHNINYNQIGMCIKNAPTFQSHLLATMFNVIPLQNEIDDFIRLRDSSKQNNLKEEKVEKNLNKNEKEKSKMKEIGKISTRIVTPIQISILEKVVNKSRVFPTIPQIPPIEEDEMMESNRSRTNSLEKSEDEENHHFDHKENEISTTDNDESMESDEEDEEDNEDFMREETLSQNLQLEIKNKLLEIIRDNYGNKKIRFNSRTLNQISRLAMTEHFLYLLLDKKNKKYRILWNCHKRSFVDITDEFKPMVFDVIQANYCK